MVKRRLQTHMPKSGGVKNATKQLRLVDNTKYKKRVVVTIKQIDEYLGIPIPNWQNTPGVYECEPQYWWYFYGYTDNPIETGLVDHVAQLIELYPTKTIVVWPIFLDVDYIKINEFDYYRRLDTDNWSDDIYAYMIL